MAILNQLLISMSLLTSLVVSYLWFEMAFFSRSMIIPSLLIFVYYIYYLNCSIYQYKYIPQNPGSIFRGRTPPAFANGWFVISRSSELLPTMVKSINVSGHNLVLFRGEDKVAYALDAFCPHSGANLGVGGVVRHKTCVQCPFHGWLFDGKTGNLVSGESLRPRKLDSFSYNEKLGTCHLASDECLTKVGEGTVNIRKYLLKEQNGYIYIWLHADPNALPNYEPLDFTEVEQRLVFKGTSMNKIFCHCQDIVENGGDIRHFIYVHSALLPFTSIFSGQWEAKWVRGDDPELREKMRHKIPWVDQHKMRLLDKYLTPSNSSSMGIMSLDMYMGISGYKHSFFFNATIFQAGPGLVYLFLISPFYEALFFQHTTSHGKFEHDVYHELYASWHLPHWSTSLMLRLEAQQVTNDTMIWNQKTFANKPKYNLDSEADKTILTWRRWFAQFYDGCAEKEKEMEKYTW